MNRYVPPTVLVVDDDPLVRTVVADLLESEGYQIVTAADAEEARELHALLSGAIVVALIDYRMPGENGLSLARMLRRQDVSMKLILMSADVSSAGSTKELDKVFDAIIPKPLDIPELLRLVKIYHEQPRKQAMNQ